jgi:hypothetical protein
VITKVNLGINFKAFKRPKTNTIKDDSGRLASDKDVQRSYQASVSELISSTLHASDEPNKQLAAIVECIKKSAEEPLKPFEGHPRPLATPILLAPLKLKWPAKSLKMDVQPVQTKSPKKFYATQDRLTIQLTQQ